LSPAARNHIRWRDRSCRRLDQPDFFRRQAEAFADFRVDGFFAVDDFRRLLADAGAVLFKT
jgi:hypothetical protein